MKKAAIAFMAIFALMVTSSPAMGRASYVLQDKEIERGMTQIEIFSILGEPLMKNTTGEVLEIYADIAVGTDIIEWFYKLSDRMGTKYLYSFLFVANTLVGVSAKEDGEEYWVLLTQY